MSDGYTYGFLFKQRRVFSKSMKINFQNFHSASAREWVPTSSSKTRRVTIQRYKKFFENFHSASVSATNVSRHYCLNNRV